MSFDDYRKEILSMKIAEIVKKLQTPGHGSSYQDIKLLQDFIDERVAERTKELRQIIMDRDAEIRSLRKKK